MLKKQRFISKYLHMDLHWWATIWLLQTFLFPHSLCTVLTLIIWRESFLVKLKHQSISIILKTKSLRWSDIDIDRRFFIILEARKSWELEIIIQWINANITNMDFKRIICWITNTVVPSTHITKRGWVSDWKLECLQEEMFDVTLSHHIKDKLIK